MEHDTVEPPENFEQEPEQGLGAEEKVPEVRQEAEQSQAEEQPKKYMCTYCVPPRYFNSGFELGRHLFNEHKEYREMKRKEKQEQKVAQIKKEVERTENEIWADIRIRGPDALAEVMRQRLEEILDSPQVPPKSRTYALKEWDQNPSIRFNFKELARMLDYDAGIKPEVALRIVEKLESIYWKYYPALQQGGHYVTYVPSSGTQPATSYSPYPPPSTTSATPPLYYPAPQTGQPYPQGGYTAPYYQPYGPSPPTPQITKEEIQRMIQDAIDRAINTFRSLQSKETELVEVDMPVGQDEEGNVITTKVKAPTSVLPWLLTQRTSQQSQSANVEKIIRELREAAIRPLEEQIKKAEEEIERARREANEARLENAKKEADRAYEELKQSRQYIESLEKEIRGRRVVEGYQSDSYRLLGQSLDKAIDMVRERKPLHEILEVLFPPTPPGNVKPMQVGEEIKELKELEEQGLVVKE